MSLKNIDLKNLNLYGSINKGLKALENSVKPNYGVDYHRQGYSVFTSKAWCGRFVSLMDIPSQLTKTVIFPVVYVAAAVASVATGALCLLGGTLLGVAGLLLYTNIHGKSCRKLSVAAFGQCPLLFAGLFALPVKGLWAGTKNALKTAGDVVGVILPEVGRMARLGTINPNNLLDDSNEKNLGESEGSSEYDEFNYPKYITRWDDEEIIG